jgi:hypothetical protein
MLSKKRQSSFASLFLQEKHWYHKEVVAKIRRRLQTIFCQCRDTEENRRYCVPLLVLKSGAGKILLILKNNLRLKWG